MAVWCCNVYRHDVERRSWHTTCSFKISFVFTGTSGLDDGGILQRNSPMFVVWMLHRLYMISLMSQDDEKDGCEVDLSHVHCSFLSGGILSWARCFEKVNDICVETHSQNHYTAQASISKQALVVVLAFQTKWRQEVADAVLAMMVKQEGGYVGGRENSSDDGAQHDRKLTHNCKWSTRWEQEQEQRMIPSSVC